MERYSHLCPTHALMAAEKDLETALTILTMIEYYTNRIIEFKKAME